jgi:hypothetical protein
MSYEYNPELSELDNFYIQNFLEYLNDYLTIECFADHKGIDDALAQFIINNGRALHEKHAINQ